MNRAEMPPARSDDEQCVLPGPARAQESFQPELRGDRVVLRPASPDELRELARAIAEDPEASPWWGQDPCTIERWLFDDETTVFIVDVEGETAGLIQYAEETDPDYRSAGIDITLLAPWIGKGLGSDALRTLCRYLFEVRGHHRLTIDPAASNARAIRAYELVGFKRVGVMRSYERASDGSWRDGLLMDMLREEFGDDSA